MKPMNASTEKTLARRATELGNSADPQALPELLELAKSVSPLVRRLAASGLGKLAGIVSAAPAVEALQPLLGDDHPQVRQSRPRPLALTGPLRVRRCRICATSMPIRPSATTSSAASWRRES